MYTLEFASVPDTICVNLFSNISHRGTERTENTEEEKKFVLNSVFFVPLESVEKPLYFPASSYICFKIDFLFQRLKAGICNIGISVFLSPVVTRCFSLRSARSGIFLNYGQCNIKATGCLLSLSRAR